MSMKAILPLGCAFLAVACVVARIRAESDATPLFQKGACYAYTLGRGAGYETERSTDSLKRVKSLGVEWVSLTPFAWYRGLADPRLELIGDRGRGAESDDTIRKAAADAHALGLRVMLKPHLWSHAGWVGDISMKNDADWETFHQNYRRVAMHFATLAREMRAEAYCIGVELRGSTLTHSAFWRALVREVRTVYDGLLVYGANWEGEFDKIEFWDALDLIGVQAFFPISERPGADAEELRRGAARVADRIGAVAERFKKPVVLTEAGFRSVADAGLRPWVEPEGVAGVEADDGGASQALCYRAILDAFWSRSWFRGLYLWKWESGGVSEPRDFHFAGKPAEKVVAEWFAKPAPR